MKAVAWNQRVQWRGSISEHCRAAVLRNEASVKGLMPQPGIQLHSWDHTADIPAHAQVAWLLCRAAALGKHGVFFTVQLSLPVAQHHCTSHPTLQEPGTVQICCLSGWRTEQVAKEGVLSYIERPRHPPSPEDRSCLCHLILKSLTQGRKKSTLWLRKHMQCFTSSMGWLNLCGSRKLLFSQ